MDITRYWRQITAFFISLGVVVGSFFAGWLFSVLVPVFVFVAFKYSGVWKNKERLVYGLTAIVIGILLFFVILSYQMEYVPTQKFTDGNYEITITNYSTPNAHSPANVDVIYKGEVNYTLHYELINRETGKITSNGTVNGTTSNGHTDYCFNITVPNGIYVVKLTVHNDTTYDAEVLRLDHNGLFHYFLVTSGPYVIFIVGLLYTLLIFGVHSIRKAQELNNLRYKGSRNNGKNR